MSQINEWGVFYHLGEEALQRGEFQQACEAFAAAAERARLAGDLSGEIHCLTPLAATLAGVGHFQEALRIGRHTLESVRRARGEAHPDTLVARGNLAQYLEAVGELALAETELRASMTGLEASAEQDAWLVALENMAQFLLRHDRLPEALPVWQRLEKAAAPGSEVLARSLMTQAHLYDALDDRSQADRCRQAALEILEGLWGRTLPLAEVLEGSGESLLQHGRPAEAAALFERCLPIVDHNFTSLHPRTHRLLDNLVAALQGSGRWEEAHQRGEQLEQALQESYGSRHPQRIKAISDQGLGLFLQERYGEAASYFEKALSLADEAPLAQQVSARYNLASAWHGAGHYSEAEALYGEALALAVDFPADSPMRSRIELNLADLLKRRESAG